MKGQGILQTHLNLNWTINFHSFWGLIWIVPVLPFTPTSAGILSLIDSAVSVETYGLRIPQIM